MERVCFLLRVKREKIQEYEERHRAVWPEMEEALRRSGWTNYSLFSREDGLLVGYLETDDFELAKRRMEQLEVNTRWQHEMAPFFEHSGEANAGPLFERLKQVFHLD